MKSEKQIKLEELFGEFLRKNTEEDDIIYIMIHFSCLVDMGLDELLKRNPTPRQFNRIVSHYPELREKITNARNRRTRSKLDILDEMRRLQ